jgi:hypothetical protein
MMFSLKLNKNTILNLFQKKIININKKINNKKLTKK